MKEGMGRDGRHEGAVKEGRARKKGRKKGVYKRPWIEAPTRITPPEQ